MCIIVPVGAHFTVHCPLDRPCWACHVPAPRARVHAHSTCIPQLLPQYVLFRRCAEAPSLPNGIFGVVTLCRAPPAMQGVGGLNEMQLAGHRAMATNITAPCALHVLDI